MTVHALADVALQFPLVARPRPACPPLDERIREIGDVARAAEEQSGNEALPLAATAHNTAALIASDCGRPDLARSLCLRQLNLYLRAQPLSAQASQYALEPVVNLARLLIRDGEAFDAYLLLDALFRAVSSRGEAEIAGTSVSFSGLTRSEQDHREVCQWLWTVLLADGTRALAGSGQWEQALASVEQRGGVGQRMLDGRQVAVLARCLAGDSVTARRVLDETEPVEQWEHAVVACLTTFCLRAASKPFVMAGEATAEQYLQLVRTPGLVVFRTRLGLAMVDVVGEPLRPSIARVIARLVDDVIETGDGYAARDILAHRALRGRLTPPKTRAMSGAVEAAGLGHEPIATALLEELLAAARTSERTTARVLLSQPLTLRH